MCENFFSSFFIDIKKDSKDMASCVSIQPANPLDRAIVVTQTAPDFLVLPFNKIEVESPLILFDATESTFVVQKKGTYECNGRIQLIYVMKPTGNIPVYTQFRITLQVLPRGATEYIPLTSSFQDLLPNEQDVNDGRWNTIVCNYTGFFRKGDALRLIVSIRGPRELDSLYIVKVGTTEPAIQLEEPPFLVPVTLFSVSRVSALCFS